MLQIGTADYQGAPLSATSTDQGAVYRSERRINSTIREREREMFGDPGDPLEYCERCNGYRSLTHRCTTNQEGTDQ